MLTLFVGLRVVVVVVCVCVCVCGSVVAVVVVVCCTKSYGLLGTGRRGEGVMEVG